MNKRNYYKDYRNEADDLPDPMDHEAARKSFRKAGMIASGSMKKFQEYAFTTLGE